jgi:hypothetical protein
MEREFPAELVAPLFLAVATATDPNRDLLFSDPPLGMTEFTNPDTRLVWIVSGALERGSSGAII